MGRPKLTLPYQGRTILETVVRTLLSSRVDRVLVVLGHHREETQAAIAHLNVTALTNPHPENGMLSSVQCALMQLPEECDAFLVALGDQPQLEAETVNALISAAAASTKGIFVPVHAGRRGHPILFRASYQEEILRLPLTVGLNILARTHPEDVEEVPVNTRSIFQDIDTPEDYRRALGEPDRTPL
jgi:molybdenum cofactor cytidylyltransferase